LPPSGSQRPHLPQRPFGLGPVPHTQLLP